MRVAPPVTLNRSQRDGNVIRRSQRGRRYRDQHVR